MIDRTSVHPDSVPALGTLLKRAARRQCPNCGGSGIYNGWISIKDECPTCGYVFVRESGYFLGALAINIVVAELLSMIILVALLIWTAWTWWQVELVVLPLALGLPFLFIPFARGLWMALDLRIQPRNQR
jgi:uncharacterized protein (DUF983 family)